MAFTPIDNLDDFTPEQEQAYYLSACAFLGVPPELGLLKFFWSDTPDGRRKKILYATKGASDIIRENRKITVLDLIQHDGPGYVSFTARGQNAEGRHEMATGASSTTGLTGKQLEIAVMFGQTKALRRMTLQFAGGGFLDESEIGTGVETTIPANVNLAELAKPVKPPQTPSVSPNSAPGRDITPEPIQTPTTPVTLPQDSQSAFNAQQEKLRQEAMEFLKSKAVISTDAASNLGPLTSAPQEASQQSEAAPEAEVKIRKPRKKRNTVDIASPGQSLEKEALKPEESIKPTNPGITPQQVEMPIGQIDKEGQITPITIVPKIEAQAAAPAPTIEGLPTAEQSKTYRDRLGKYSNDILPMQGGMMPVAGFGGPTIQLREFYKLQTGLENVQQATATQWEEFLTFLDEYVAANGVKALVAYIRQALGIK